MFSGGSKGDFGRRWVNRCLTGSLMRFSKTFINSFVSTSLYTNEFSPLKLYNIRYGMRFDGWNCLIYGDFEIFPKNDHVIAEEVTPPISVFKKFEKKTPSFSQGSLLKSVQKWIEPSTIDKLWKTVQLLIEKTRLY